MADITMPQLGETVTEGTITKWFKNVGDRVERDELLFEVSTDKVDSEVPSPAAGVLTEIRVPEGSTVDVGVVLAVIGEGAPAASTAPAAGPAVGTAAPAPQTAVVDATSTVPTAPPGPPPGPPQGPPQATLQPAHAQAVVETAAFAPAVPATASSEGINKVLSPVVRKLISENNLDPATLTGTGIGGRITREDVLDAIDVRAAAAAHAQPAPVVPAPAGSAATGAHAVRTPEAPATAPAPAPASPVTAPAVDVTSEAAPAPAPATAPAPAPASPVTAPAVDVTSEAAPAPAPVMPAGPAVAAVSVPVVPASAAPAVPAVAEMPAMPAMPAMRPGGRSELVPFTNIRRRTGEHMIGSIHTAPHAFIAVEVDYSGVDAVRARQREGFKADEGFSLTYMPFISRAVVDAIRKFPHVNASVSGDALVVHHSVHLGVAVDLDFQGLMVPVIRDADGKRMRAIARDINDLAGRARTKKLTPDDIVGGTFTLSNAGPYGIDLMQSIINQPQVAILSITSVKKRAVVLESAVGGDAIAVRPIGMLGLSWDHRAFDGAYAASFLHEVKSILESKDWSSEL